MPHEVVPSSMSDLQDPLPVLAAYSVATDSKSIHCLAGAGGFSGARFWRVETDQGPLCLRRWPPEYPKAGDLAFIHAVLAHAAGSGFQVAAVPMVTMAGASYVTHSGHFWELMPWLPGRADFWAEPSETRLTAAMRCLAQFHRAIEEFRWSEPGGHPIGCPARAVSPGICKRIGILREWLSGRAGQLEDALRRGAGWPEMLRRAERLLHRVPRWAPVVSGLLAQFDRRQVPLQPCIRDVWHDHILFEGDRVTGLIDFGSTGVDNVSCDVARLLGSLAGSNARMRQVGLAAYATVRPLSDVEAGMVEAFDLSGILLGALNWAAWVLLEGREFEEPDGVLHRMDALMSRLETDPLLPPEGRGLIL